MQTYRAASPPDEGLRGTGDPRRPSRRSEGLMLRRNGGSVFSHLRAMVLEDIQMKR
jgi:hypothetical protein